jgi:hypothetical protein
MTEPAHVYVNVTTPVDASERQHGPPEPDEECDDPDTPTSAQHVPEG